MTRLHELYESTVKPDLIKAFGYKNPMQAPKLDKIVLNMGIGEGVTDRKKVVAAARDRTHCESPAGRYHFVETKNVNAFLMRIERAPRRKSADRCAELTFALDCLSRRGR